MKITGMVRFLTLLSLTIITFLAKCQGGPVRSTLVAQEKQNNNQDQRNYSPLLLDLVDGVYQPASKPNERGTMSDQSESQVQEGLAKEENRVREPEAKLSKRPRRSPIPVPLMSIRMAPIELYGLPEGNALFEERERRKFPEVDSRGFDEDIFDEGFGEFHPMKRWPH